MDCEREGLDRQFRAQSDMAGAVSRRTGLVALTRDDFLDQILVNTRLGKSRLENGHS
jgi:hypothetical protein